jgi:pantoate--beta-alanine ligase
MQVAETVSAVRRFLTPLRRGGKSIGMVPTMGALHVGHLSLIAAARRACDVVVVSIFVNPTQFGPQEDLEAYPRPLEADLQQCRAAGVDLVFHPPVHEMYPSMNQTWVRVEGITEPLCGRRRPGHFQGVTTVCAKLFHIVQPDQAFFGQKDAQQALVIRRMVADLNVPLEIVVCPTVREEDGLAVSSRNTYLTPEERAQAPTIYRSLQACRERMLAGERNRRTLERTLHEDLAEVAGARIDYAAILEAESLKPLESVRGRVLVAVAVQLASARLIDNIVVDVPD